MSSSPSPPRSPTETRSTHSPQWLCPCNSTAARAISPPRRRGGRRLRAVPRVPRRGGPTGRTTSPRDPSPPRRDWLSRVLPPHRYAEPVAVVEPNPPLATEAQVDTEDEPPAVHLVEGIEEWEKAVAEAEREMKEEGM